MGQKDEYHRLRYALWDDRFYHEKPYTIVSHLPQLDESRQANIKFGEGPDELITDVRGKEGEFSLDNNGFAFVSHAFPKFDPTDAESVEKNMYPVFEEFLKQHVQGVDRVHFFDYRVRSNQSYPSVAMTEVPNRAVPLPPAKGVHIDQSPGGALKRVRAFMGDEAGFLLRGRTRIINIWFPYDYPIEDCPLALCDGSTVQAKDLLIADHVTRTYVGETVYPMYNDQSRWYYLSEQTRDEVLLFKIFDSDEAVPARYVPHTSFELNTSASEARPRKSFEIRAMVFTHPKDEG
ncbi:hypothetical protein GE09DRAFT_761510 [Coniochaeta sp. 2T2.1]|nr:hypothetical protein GE09DRAFT_761510 [Coniochaeta sp. 2T2.1]